MECLQLRDRHEDDDSLFASTNIDLTSGRDLEDTELGLELRHVVFEVNQSLGDLGLDLVGGGSGRIGGTEDLGGDGHLERGALERGRSTSNLAGCASNTKWVFLDGDFCREQHFQGQEASHWARNGETETHQSF